MSAARESARETARAERRKRAPRRARLRELARRVRDGVAARADAVGAVRALLKAGAGEITTALVAAVRARSHRAMALLAPAAAANGGPIFMKFVKF